MFTSSFLLIKFIHTAMLSFKIFKCVNSNKNSWKNFILTSIGCTLLTHD